MRARGGGAIVNISSTAGRRPFEGCTSYCTTKYGLRGFSDALRLDLAEHGIRVSTVYPGATDTTIFDGVPGDWDPASMNAPEDAAEVVQRVLHGRDVMLACAHANLFLVAPGPAPQIDGPAEESLAPRLPQRCLRQIDDQLPDAPFPQQPAVELAKAGQVPRKRSRAAPLLQ